MATGAGALAQPAISAAATSAAQRPRLIIPRMESGLWIIVLEAAVALAMLAFIVWWTVPGKRRDTEPDERSKKD
jgi:hypothetical protein